MGLTSACDECIVGQFQRRNGSAECFKCIPGQYQSAVGQAECLECALNTYTDTVEQDACLVCAAGKYTVTNGSSTCLSCVAGRFGERFGENCRDCPVGWFRATEDLNVSRCVQCEKGETTQTTHHLAALHAILHGTVNRSCDACRWPLQDERRKTDCKTCVSGLIPNEKKRHVRNLDDCARLRTIS